MKIRINGNSLRLRLTTEEWQRFKDVGKVEDSIRFDAQKKLIYTLKLSDDVTGITPCFNYPFVMVLIPKRMGAYWIQGDEVGLMENLKLPDGTKLQILIEKDFKCLQPRAEDETALFANPKATER